MKISAPKIVIIGAGIGGLTAAIELARLGADVMVLERAATPGGKMRTSIVQETPIDAGPTVLTLRSIFDDIFAAAGARLDDYAKLTPLACLARHFWPGGDTLDLLADQNANIAAIETFAGRHEAEGYRRFAKRAGEIYRTLDESFIRASRPNPLQLITRAGISGLGDLWKISPFETLWQSLGTFFQDQRLRQLFARYATYCGSSPFSSPATLMLIAHVEALGVWLVDGGMHQLAIALMRLGKEHGAMFRFDTEAVEIIADNGCAAAVRLFHGEIIPADAIIFNGEFAALESGLLGKVAKRAAPVLNAPRSLSAITWATSTEIGDFPLRHHNVFFNADYRAEFDALFHKGETPLEPTVYICAQDRNETTIQMSGPERLLILINAPAIGDRDNTFSQEEMRQCERRMLTTLEQCGLKLKLNAETTIVTNPRQFHQLFPASGGALYGMASHGWAASFRRPGARSQLKGLYLAGGSVHPGAGVPMAALSGRQAAQEVIKDLVARADLVSTRHS